MEQVSEQELAAIRALVQTENVRLRDELQRLRNSLRPEWDDDGEPQTLTAAAMDALEWLNLMDYLISDRKVWAFSRPDSLEKLRYCRRSLQRLLQSAPGPGPSERSEELLGEVGEG